MKNFIFGFLAISLLVACKKGDESTTKTIQLHKPFSLEVNQSAELPTEDWKIMLLEITEGRCPHNGGACIWAGRVVAEFMIEKNGETTLKTLTDNPSGDPSLSTEFEAFGHVFKLDEVAPYPENSPIEQSDYVVKITVE